MTLSLKLSFPCRHLSSEEQNLLFNPAVKLLWSFGIMAKDVSDSASLELVACRDLSLILMSSV